MANDFIGTHSVAINLTIVAILVGAYKYFSKDGQAIGPSPRLSEGSRGPDSIAIRNFLPLLDSNVGLSPKRLQTFERLLSPGQETRLHEIEFLGIQLAIDAALLYCAILDFMALDGPPPQELLAEFRSMFLEALTHHNFPHVDIYRTLSRFDSAYAALQGGFSNLISEGLSGNVDGLSGRIHGLVPVLAFGRPIEELSGLPREDLQLLVKYTPVVESTVALFPITLQAIPKFAQAA